MLDVVDDSHSHGLPLRIDDYEHRVVNDGVLCQVDAVVCYRDLEQPLHAVFHGDGAGLSVKEEVVVEGDLLGRLAIDEAVASAAFEIVLYRHFFVDIEQEILHQ